jgi:hypothetical protein
MLDRVGFHPFRVGGTRNVWAKRWGRLDDLAGTKNRTIPFRRIAAEVVEASKNQLVTRRMMEFSCNLGGS